MEFCPTITQVGPPPGAPAAAGHCSARSIGRASNGLRVPIAKAPPKRAATLGNRDPTPDNWISEISLRLFKARNLARSVLRNFPRDFSFLLCAKSNTETQLSNFSLMELDQNPRLVLFKERWGSSVRSSGLVLLGGGKLGPKISCRSPAWARSRGDKRD